MELTFFESLEIKFLCFNILNYISGTTAISSVSKFKLAQHVILVNITYSTLHIDNVSFNKNYIIIILIPSLLKIILNTKRIKKKRYIY